MLQKQNICWSRLHNWKSWGKFVKKLKYIGSLRQIGEHTRVGGPNVQIVKNWPLLLYQAFSMNYDWSNDDSGGHNSGSEHDDHNEKKMTWPWDELRQRFVGMDLAVCISLMWRRRQMRQLSEFSRHHHPISSSHVKIKDKIKIFIIFFVGIDFTLSCTA